MRTRDKTRSINIFNIFDHCNHDVFLIQNKGVGLNFAPLHFTFFFSTPEVINKATILEPGGEAHTQTHGSEQM